MKTVARRAKKMLRTACRLVGARMRIAAFLEGWIKLAGSAVVTRVWCDLVVLQLRGGHDVSAGVKDHET
jgi:hypothetical protein